MKSVKMLLGTVLCLVMLSGQAMAMNKVVLDFETVDVTNTDINVDLNNYGAPYGVTFSNWGAIADFGNDVEITKTLGARSNGGSATINFGTNGVYLNTFDYELSGSAASINAVVVNNDPVSLPLNIGYTESINLSDWSMYLIQSITFTLSSGSTLFVDKVTFTPTPLPGAAVLVFSGLLGLVGLRRRQIV